jgi:GNAT superfamily N-acetyltransferase
VQGETAGFLSVWEPDRFIHNLFVDKKYRRAGIGRQLIRWALLEYGTPLSLKCAAANTAALEFYQNSGWQTDGEGRGEEGLYYLLSLRKAK